MAYIGSKEIENQISIIRNCEDSIQECVSELTKEINSISELLEGLEVVANTCGGNKRSKKIELLARNELNTNAINKLSSSPISISYSTS